MSWECRRRDDTEGGMALWLQLNSRGQEEVQAAPSPQPKGCRSPAVCREPGEELTAAHLLQGSPHGTAREYLMAKGWTWLRQLTQGPGKCVCPALGTPEGGDRCEQCLSQEQQQMCLNQEHSAQTL